MRKKVSNYINYDLIAGGFDNFVKPTKLMLFCFFINTISGITARQRTPKTLNESMNAHKVDSFTRVVDISISVF